VGVPDDDGRYAAHRWRRRADSLEVGGVACENSSVSSVVAVGGERVGVVGDVGMAVRPSSVVLLCDIVLRSRSALANSEPFARDGIIASNGVERKNVSKLSFGEDDAKVGPRIARASEK